MSEEPFNPNTSYVLQHTTRRVRAFVNELNYRIDVDTLHREETDTLRLNEIGRVKITTTQPLFFDSYRLNRATGNFILIDPSSNTTVAAGINAAPRPHLGRGAAQATGTPEIKQCGLGEQPDRS